MYQMWTGMLDRDFNASINIMFEGLKLYMENYKKNYAII